MVTLDEIDDEDPNLKKCSACGGVLSYIQTHGERDEWKCLHCNMPTFMNRDDTIRWIRLRLDTSFPETWQAKIGNDYYLVEKSTKRDNAWCIGFSNRPKDFDLIMRGVYYDSLQIAQAFCEQFAKVSP